jgi:hypothetical protein
MKNSKFLVGFILGSFAVAVLLIAGCGLINPDRPPSATEQRYFTITTNVTPVASTNVQARVTISTNANGVAVAAVTNFVEVPVVVFKTNYVMVPNANAEATASNIGTLTNYALPGVGGAVTLGLLGLLKLWGSLRSGQAVSKNLAQIVETARSVIFAQPNGAQLALTFDNWMMKHQNDAQLANEIAKLVDATVDPSGADQTAQNLLRDAAAPLTPAPKS